MKRLAPLLFILLACPRVNGDSKRPPTAPDGGSALARAHIDLVVADGRAFGLEVELALTDADRERGLMFRKELVDGTGMLFVFPTAAPHTFWMKNTLIPLDMVFADDVGGVLGCVARAEPMTLTGRTVAGASKYVLELPGGWCADHGGGPGAKIIVGEAGRFRAE